MEHNKKFKFFIGFVLLTVIVIISVIAIYHKVKTSPGMARRIDGLMPVGVAVVSERTINDIIGASGQVEESGRAYLTALISQTVLSVHKDIGDLVDKGEVLVEFDRKLALASLEEAKAALTGATAGMKYSELNLERMKKLFAQGHIAVAELEEAEERLIKSKQEMSSAKLRFQEADLSMSNTVLRNPIKGIVLERDINVGEVARQDSRLFTIGLLDNVFMLAEIAEDMTAHVRLKQSAEINFEAFKNVTFYGEIVKMDPVVDPKTRTFTAYIRVVNDNMRLTPGMSGYARIQNNVTSLAIPSLSIVTPLGDKSVVFVLGNDSTVRIREVKTGISGGGFTEIVDGLKYGEKVVTAGIQYLKDGDKVRVMEGM